MHCHGFFRGVLFTVIDAIVACFGHFVRCCLVVCATCDCSVSVCVCVCVCSCEYSCVQKAVFYCGQLKVNRVCPCLPHCDTKRSICWFLLELNLQPLIQILYLCSCNLHCVVVVVCGGVNSIPYRLLTIGNLLSIPSPLAVIGS